MRGNPGLHAPQMKTIINFDTVEGRSGIVNMKMKIKIILLDDFPEPRYSCHS